MNLAFASTSSTVAALAKGVNFFAAKPQVDFLVLTLSYFTFVMLGGCTVSHLGLLDSSFLFTDCPFSLLHWLPSASKC